MKLREAFVHARNQFGFSLVEIMIAIGLTGFLSAIIMKLGEQGQKNIKMTEAKSDAQLIQALVSSAISHPQGCYSTFSGLITNSNASAYSSSTGVAVNEIRDKNNNIILKVGTKKGDITVSSMKISNYNTSTGTANLEINGKYKLSSSQTMQVKKISIPLNIAESSGNLSSCSSATSGNSTGPWSLMASPSLGIYYNSGSVLIGSGYSDTQSFDPAFAMGTNNKVNAGSSMVVGYQNAIDSNGKYSLALGGSNVIQSVYSFAAGQANTVYISTGSVGVSGPMASIALGRVNKVTGSEAVAIGYGNQVMDRFSTALGAQNQISGSGSTAIGTWNVVTGNNAIGIGQYAEGNGNYSTAIGRYVKSNALGSMTLGDSSTSTYVVNSMINSFTARFENGFSFFTDANLSQTTGIFFGEKGYVGIGRKVASNANIKLEVVGGTTQLQQETPITIGDGSANSPVYMNGWKGYPGLELKYYKDSTGRVWFNGGVCNWGGGTCGIPSSVNRFSSISANRYTFNAGLIVPEPAVYVIPSAFILPAEYRPTSSVAKIVSCTHRYAVYPVPGICTVFIWSSGVVDIYTHHPERYPMFDGVSFLP